MALEMKKLIVKRKIKPKLLRELSKTEFQKVYIKFSEGVNPESYATQLLEEGTIREYRIENRGIETVVRKIEIPLLASREKISWIARIDEKINF